MSEYSMTHNCLDVDHLTRNRNSYDHLFFSLIYCRQAGHVIIVAIVEMT
jgi:hypothetical protein